MVQRLGPVKRRPGAPRSRVARGRRRRVEAQPAVTARAPAAAARRGRMSSSTSDPARPPFAGGALHPTTPARVPFSQSDCTAVPRTGRPACAAAEPILREAIPLRSPCRLNPASMVVRACRSTDVGQQPAELNFQRDGVVRERGSVEGRWRSPTPRGRVPAINVVADLLASDSDGRRAYAAVSSRTSLALPPKRSRRPKTALAQRRLHLRRQPVEATPQVTGTQCKMDANRACRLRPNLAQPPYGPAFRARSAPPAQHPAVAQNEPIVGTGARGRLMGMRRRRKRAASQCH